MVNITLQPEDLLREDIHVEIVTAPKFGDVYRSDGQALFFDVIPVVKQFASFVPEYSPDWGPSWSAQVSSSACELQ